MISLLDVNTYAVMTLECLANGDKTKSEEISNSLTSKTSDRKEVLDKLQKRAEELQNDNAWNRYESADEAYGYAEELANLLSEMVFGDTDYDELEWQIQDVATKTQREAYYRLERAQW